MSGIVGANFIKESGLKRSHKFQRFTIGNPHNNAVNGIWVKPSGITTVYIEIIGGGAGGGGARGNSGATHGGAGGGAAIAMGTYNAASLPDTLTFIVAPSSAGGYGAQSSNGQDGWAGTNTTVTAGSKIILTAFGGGCGIKGHTSDGGGGGGGGTGGVGGNGYNATAGPGGKPYLGDAASGGNSLAGHGGEGGDQAQSVSGNAEYGGGGGGDASVGGGSIFGAAGGGGGGSVGGQWGN